MFSLIPGVSNITLSQYEEKYKCRQTVLSTATCVIQRRSTIYLSSFEIDGYVAYAWEEVVAAYSNII
jgi:hypothetical protein